MELGIDELGAFLNFGDAIKEEFALGLDGLGLSLSALRLAGDQKATELFHAQKIIFPVFWFCAAGAFTLEIHLFSRGFLPKA